MTHHPPVPYSAAALHRLAGPLAAHEFHLTPMLTRPELWAWVCALRERAERDLMNECERWIREVFKGGSWHTYADARFRAFACSYESARRFAVDHDDACALPGVYVRAYARVVRGRGRVSDGSVCTCMAA